MIYLALDNPMGQRFLCAGSPVYAAERGFCMREVRLLPSLLLLKSKGLPERTIRGTRKHFEFMKMTMLMMDLGAQSFFEGTFMLFLLTVSLQSLEHIGFSNTYTTLL